MVGYPKSALAFPPIVLKSTVSIEIPWAVGMERRALLAQPVCAVISTVEDGSVKVAAATISVSPLKAKGLLLLLSRLLIRLTLHQMSAYLLILPLLVISLSEYRIE